MGLQALLSICGRSSPPDRPTGATEAQRRIHAQENFETYEKNNGKCLDGMAEGGFERAIVGWDWHVNYFHETRRELIHRSKLSRNHTPRSPTLVPT